MRAEERRPATLAFLARLGITAAHTLIETARDALFLTKVPITYLPALYLAIAAAARPHEAERRPRRRLIQPAAIRITNQIPPASATAPLRTRTPWGSNHSFCRMSMTIGTTSDIAKS